MLNICMCLEYKKISDANISGLFMFLCRDVYQVYDTDQTCVVVAKDSCSRIFATLVNLGALAEPVHWLNVGQRHVGRGPL